MIVSWSCRVLAQMLSTACAFTLGLRGDGVVGRKCLLLRSNGAGVRSVEPGVLFGDIGVVERGR